ncbi:helix-turn-helix domain-containing protein [Paenibacillus yanchengensis]|uniref:Helix-turn-helix domain-containing protein n=1 Tax=Paenibacillus yanchengensis TaxID=2035833 RepID=A0ABW4YNE3_9BACL
MEQLALKLHFSVKQTYRVIQQLYGKSFKEIVKDYKMERANELLKSTSLTLYQISDILGYNELDIFHVNLLQLQVLLLMNFACNMLEVSDNNMTFCSP